MTGVPDEYRSFRGALEIIGSDSLSKIDRWLCNAFVLYVLASSSLGSKSHSGI